MKVFSADTAAIIESGNYIKFECWQITLQNNGSPTNYYLTAGDAPLTIGGNLYQTGITIKRGSITTKRGLQPGSVDLTMAPQGDASNQPTFSGGSFLPQLSSGIFDGSIWLLSKGFFAFPGSGTYTSSTGHTYTAPPIGSQLDTSPGIVPWWGGVMGKAQVGRMLATVTLDEITALLNNIMMPRNCIQAGCVHTLFDAGCTLNASQNTYSGSVVANSGNLTQTNLSSSSYVAGYFNLGIVTFTSGVLDGASFTVQSSYNSGAQVYLNTVIPFPSVPNVGDTFTIVPGCDKTWAMCKSGKFKLPSGSFGSNAAHYRGCPFVPNPETLYDGGTGSQTLSTIGRQGTPVAGSPYTGKQ